MSLDSSAPLDPRARFWARAATGAAILVGGFVIAPYIWIALGGLIGLGTAIGVLAGTLYALPVIAAKAANLRLKLIKSEAATNPVETLQGEHARQTELLNERRKGIETMAGAVRVLKETIGKLEREFPDSPELEQMKADYGELKGLEDSRNADWQEAYVTLGMFAKEIQRASRIWDVAQAAARARGLSGLTQDEWMAKLKTETSFDSIRTKLNTELSALSTERMQVDADRILKGKLAERAKPAATATQRPSMVNADVAPSQRVAAKQSLS